ncbi:MAG: ATP-binding protein [Deltaproteobacteria bacterium]|jgi:signal transduction histidine kinase|nr:ATP-binding protein [Deltaproteobacteria bacterium]MDA8308424.1 ATP-binding protein [Deltaproteobacteria bacterium]
MRAIETEEQVLESVKPFKLVKYLAISSLVVILACTIVLSGFISQKAKELLLEKSEQYALLVAENLNHQVFYLFTLPTLITEGAIRLSDPIQHDRLDMVVKNTIHGLSVKSVNIYDKNEILVYSTGKGKIGSKGHIGAPFQSALNEQPVSVLSPGGNSFFGFGLKGGKLMLVTYLPMWVERPLSWKKGRVLGVFEITQDITRDYKTIRRFQWIVALSFLLFVGILFSTILFIARRAERIITARNLEKHKLEEKLNQSERLASLGEMIAGVSHEIRNPLGIIRSTAELLDSRVEGDRLKRFSSIIVEESTRLNDILTEFLDFARPQTIRPVTCRIEDILDRNLFILEAECQRLRISVQKRYQTGDYCLEADQDMLYRAFVNIFANAIQAMPEGGELTVQTSIPNGRNGASLVEIRVQDTGCGIPKEALKKIFNPFFTTRENGTGLGLAIVRSIVDNHSGEIEVVSKEGEGAAIIIRLPLTQPEYELEREASQ